MIEHLRRTAGISLAVLATLTGCTGSPGPAAQHPTPSTSGVPASSATASPTPTFVLEPVQQFDLGARVAWPIAMTPTEVVAPVTSSGGADPTEVWLLDLGTGGESVIARSQWQTGAIVGVAVSGQWIVWVDVTKVTGPSLPSSVLWNIWAKNPKSGRQILLDTNGPGGTVAAVVPTLVSGDGYIGWTRQGSDPTTTQQLLWQPGSGHPRDLQLEGFGRVSAIADGRLIFLRLSTNESDRARGLGDCWSYPVNGTGTAQQLTQSGRVLGCTTNGTDLVWTEHIDPATNRPAKVRKVGDAPYLLMTRSLDGQSAPLTIHEGKMATRQPIAGTGFTWWIPSSAPVISSLTTEAQLTVQDADPSYGWMAAASGQLVAYQLRSPKNRTVITVTKVVPQLASTSPGSSSPSLAP